MSCLPTYKGKRYNSLEELYKSSEFKITPQQKQQAQQQYSQYLDSLNKPNTNPILQNNQQEQVKKFTELQERLNNKEFLEGAKNTYENSKELKSFGTQEEYDDYIARVSLGIIKNPSSGDYNYTSKVKDIVYHGTLPQNKFEKFDKQKGTNLSGEYGGIHFGDLTAAIERPTKIVKAENFLAGIEEDLSNFKPNIIPVILNIDNIKRVEEGKNWGQGDWSNLISKENEADGYIYTNKIENKGKDSYVVFEPEQIHILGSKQDKEGFKKFMKYKQNVLSLPMNKTKKDIIDNIELYKDFIGDMTAEDIQNADSNTIAEILKKICK